MSQHLFTGSHRVYSRDKGIGVLWWLYWGWGWRWSGHSYCHRLKYFLFHVVSAGSRFRCMQLWEELEKDSMEVRIVVEDEDFCNPQNKTSKMTSSFRGSWKSSISVDSGPRVFLQNTCFEDFFFVCLGCKAILKYTCSVIFVFSYGSSKIQPAFPVIQVYYTVRFLSVFHSWSHIIRTTEPSLRRSQVYMPSWRIANSTLYYKQITELCSHSYKDVSEGSYSCKCSWRQQLSLSFLELPSVSRKFVR